MILPFSTKFPDGKPTYFIEKIWASIPELKTPYKFNYEELFVNKFNVLWDGWGESFKPKKHTIRADIHNRWKPGNKIHMVVFNRSKNQFQFAPVLECKSVQKIEIIYSNPNSDYPFVKIDGARYNVWEKSGLKMISEIAINDGFKSDIDFFQWFNKDFQGKIIHWTDLRY
ncbi:MAG: hypothetical protein CVU09_00305 [Bacteroidetes bacterium HGW-Bacteroidetes-4]|jgi:hypothetical protein|nr:MAG: hypothetical protein CVU09_00305 [Bacteroidetes bacterium HGW-Bacteroidetes-4]